MTLSQPMTERMRRPDWVQRLNRMADSVGGDARVLVPFDAAELLSQATQSTGGMPASDLGDPRWQNRFEALVAALDGADLHLVGRLMCKQELLRGLRTRLSLMREVDAKPAIEAERIDSPVIVTGPARSGTTILFELLWLDPELRAPVAADALHPLPRNEGDAMARALSLAECEQEFWADVQPEFAAIHELRSDLPVECVTLTIPSFCGTHWPMVASPLEGWEPDLPLNYDFERRILQLMQHGAAPQRWLLKTPGHLMTLEMLFDTFPDAWVIQTHRDPAKTMTSTISTSAMIQWLRTDQIDLPVLAALIQGGFGAALNHSAELRESNVLPDRMVDIHFRSLITQPVETLRAAYAQMGRELGEEHAEAIRAYLADKPQGKFGTHRYSPEEWGIDVASLNEQLEPYIAYFGVELE